MGREYASLPLAQYTGPQSLPALHDWKSYGPPLFHPCFVKHMLNPLYIPAALLVALFAKLVAVPCERDPHL